ncbi:MAG: fumarylacetoacetate hydrolase family protein [Chitinophagales bacterium]
MKLYKIPEGVLLEDSESAFELGLAWDELINRNDLHGFLKSALKEAKSISANELELRKKKILPPIGSQEVWAAGVTYLRSREARMEESRKSGGADFYDKVYDAERPELFFKALAHRVSGSGQDVFIRRDSSWNVPEPELVLFINSFGKIQAYTIGNDMSSRSIEGENPLYLPQAKVYEKSAALGPCLFVPGRPIEQETIIDMIIFRNGKQIFKDSVSIKKMKRSHDELAAFLFRECDFKTGVFLMTGTCLVPPNDFTLQVNDAVDISISGIGTLSNRIGMRSGT